MDSDNQPFRHNFEVLLSMFKKLADKMSKGEIEGTNPEFAKQFKMMLSQYEMMKHMMPHDIPEQFREPFRHMMENMIYHLQEEIGEDIFMGENEETTEKKSENEITVEDIETMLGRPDLEPAEMDKLLDELTELKSKRDE